MIAALAELGIPLSVAATDPQHAQSMGFVKASLYHGYALVQAGERAVAVQHVDTVLERVEKLAPADRPPLRAAAYSVQARALEAGGATADALAHSRKALEQVPTLAFALKGVERLTRA